MGFWVVKWLVNHAGGSLSFEENERGGTIVKMTFPRDSPHLNVSVTE